MSGSKYQHEGQGLYILSFFESAGEVSPVFEQKARDLFSEYGLEDVEEEEYYPGDQISDAFFEVVDEVGEMTMRQGGEQMGKDVPWPPSVSGPHEGLAAIDDVHQEAARASKNAPPGVDRPAGGYSYEQTGPSSAHVGITEGYPYPEIMAEGVFVGIVKGLGASSASIREATPSGDEIAAWEISW